VLPLSNSPPKVPTLQQLSAPRANQRRLITRVAGEARAWSTSSIETDRELALVGPRSAGACCHASLLASMENSLNGVCTW